MGAKIAYKWLSAVGPSPCEGCALATYCKVERTACRDFGIYSYEGLLVEIDRTPTREQYDSIFRGEAVA